MKRSAIRFWAFLSALSLLLSLAACGRKGATAASMHLRRTEGTVFVFDGDGKDITVLDNLGLYSGYEVRTRFESYAWIDLDDVKLAKLDQKSEISIEKEGKALNIELKSGSLFFNVTKPLEDDETMNIRTSTMLVGIRGTCGWVEDNGGLSRVYLLEGRVECSAEGQRVRVDAGEMAELTEDGGLVVKPFTARDIPDFVLDEIDDDLARTILEASGMDILNPPDPAELLRAEYMDIINSHPILDEYAYDGAVYRANGLTYASEGLSYAAVVDFDGDGMDELFLVTQHGPWSLTKLEVYGGSQGQAALYGEVDLLQIGKEYDGHPASYFELAENNGRIYAIVMYGVQAVEGFLVYTVENNELILVERTRYDRLVTEYTTNWDLTLNQNLCPPLPDDARMKNALAACIDTYASPQYYYFAKWVNKDLYRLDIDRTLDKCSWNGTEIEHTVLEDNIVYAKLIDMDRDGEEELLLITEDSHVIAYSWDNTGMRKYELLDFLQDPAADDGIYRKKATGEIYIGTGWVSIGNAEGWDFVSLTDSVHLDWAWTYSSSERYWIYEYGSPEEIQKMEAEMEIDNAEWEKFEAQRDQFELIENLYPYLHGNNYEWQNQLWHTVDETLQQLMAR